MRYEFIDASRRGLMLRVFPSGIKTFIFRYPRKAAFSGCLAQS
jgi:hypothetical protein